MDYNTVVAAAADAGGVGRLVEEIRAECGGLKIEPDIVYMSSALSDFIHSLVLLSRGISLQPQLIYHTVSLSDYLLHSSPVNSAWPSLLGSEWYWW